MFNTMDEIRRATRLAAQLKESPETETSFCPTDEAKCIALLGQTHLPLIQVRAAIGSYYSELLERELEHNSFLRAEARWTSKTLLPYTKEMRIFTMLRARKKKLRGNFHIDRKLQTRFDRVMSLLDEIVLDHPEIRERLTMGPWDADPSNDELPRALPVGEKRKAVVRSVLSMAASRPITTGQGSSGNI